MATRTLCLTCLHKRDITTPKGSHFLLCTFSQTDSRFPKYPPQPITRCDAYVQERPEKEADAD